MTNYGLFVHREQGLTFIQSYETPIEAYQARLAYVDAAVRRGFKARRGIKAVFLKHPAGVRLEVWVGRVEDEREN